MCCGGCIQHTLYRRDVSAVEPDGDDGVQSGEHDVAGTLDQRIRRINPKTLKMRARRDEGHNDMGRK